MNDQNFMNELMRISKQVHENHKLLVFIANRFRVGQSDFSNEDQALQEAAPKVRDALNKLNPPDQTTTN